MGILKNAKHERFAQYLARGDSASASYVAAGYRKDDGNAARLTGNDKVKARVSEILTRAAEKVGVTIESITAELEEARKLALSSPKGASAAVSASMGKAKLHKLLDEEKQAPTVAVTVIIGTRDAGML